MLIFGSSTPSKFPKEKGSACLFGVSYGTSFLLPFSLSTLSDSSPVFSYYFDEGLLLQ